MNEGLYYKSYNELVRKFGTPEPEAPDTFEYVIEECSELIQAIQHMKRKRKDAFQHVVTEMAHVYTLMDALCYNLKISADDIDYYKQQLIDRYLNQPNDGRHVEQEQISPIPSVQRGQGFIIYQENGGHKPDK